MQDARCKICEERPSSDAERSHHTKNALSVLRTVSNEFFPRSMSKKLLSMSAPGESGTSGTVAVPYSSSEPFSAPIASTSSSISRNDGFFMSDRRCMTFCRSNELGGRDIVDVIVSVDCWRRTIVVRADGGGERGFMGTTLTRFNAAASASCRSWREGRRLGGGGRLADGNSGECVAVWKLGDAGGVRLACAVDGRCDSGGGRFSAFASIEELREGPPRVGSTRVTFRICGECAIDGRAPLTDDFEERIDPPLETPALSPAGPNANVPVEE